MIHVIHRITEFRTEIYLNFNMECHEIGKFVSINQKKVHIIIQMTIQNYNLIMTYACLSKLIVLFTTHKPKYIF